MMVQTQLKMMATCLHAKSDAQVRRGHVGVIAAGCESRILRVSMCDECFMPRESIAMRIARLVHGMGNKCDRKKQFLIRV